jgi:hypothetical protein
LCGRNREFAPPWNAHTTPSVESSVTADQAPMLRVASTLRISTTWVPAWAG